MDPLEIFKADNRRIVLVAVPTNPPRTMIVDVQSTAALMEDDEGNHQTLVENLRAAGADQWDWEKYRNLFK